MTATMDIDDPRYRRDLVARDAHRARSATGDACSSSWGAYGQDHAVTILSQVANKITGHLAADAGDLTDPAGQTREDGYGQVEDRDETNELAATLAALHAGGRDHDELVASHHARHPWMPWAPPTDPSRDGSLRYTTSRDDAHRLVPTGWTILATCAVRTHPEPQFACIGYGPEWQRVTAVGRTEALAIAIAATLMRDGRPPQPQTD